MSPFGEKKSTKSKHREGRQSEHATYKSWHPASKVLMLKTDAGAGARRRVVSMDER
jgi:hypothetical protein